jgi:preprotein translocase SecE subunit
MSTATEPTPPTAQPPEAPRGMFAPYKEDQGRHVRMGAFWTVVFFVGFGCRFLHDFMIQWKSLAEPLGGLRIPVVGVNLSPAFLISSLFFLAGVVLTKRWQQKPKVADMLIDTEAELKKVSWPKGQEVWNASMVVVVCVVLLAGFLMLSDWIVFRLMGRLIFGGA